MNKAINDINCIDDNYDSIVVGGGIVGAGIFRDLSLNGAKTLIIDKKDFSSQTSSKSSKMLHGGIRYLENMDFDLVFEALHEKNLWLKIAPHLCYDSSFFLPVYKDSLRPLWMIKAGMLLYDVLSQFKNTPHRMVNRSKTLEALPQLKEEGLVGAGVYHDAIVDDARLTIEVILDGIQQSNSHALNHVALENFTINKDQTTTVELIDELTQKKRTVKCKELILATGPFTDSLLSNHHQISWERRLLPSKGSHLWLKASALQINSPMVLTPNDGRVIFVIPQKDKILVGTTEVECKDDFFNLEPSVQEIEYLLENLKNYFPSSNVTNDDIIGKFSGIRPLVMEDTATGRAKTARNHKYFQPHHNLHVIMGGKYTTFRVMAQEVVRVVCNKLGLSYNSNLSVGPLSYRPKYFPFKVDSRLTESDIQYIRTHELVRTEDDLQNRIT